MNRYSMTAAATLLALTTTLAEAQPPGGGILRMDSDGDGRISREEFAPPTQRRGRGPFAEADANGDGEITRDEMEAALTEGEERRRQHLRAQFDQVDRDGNGVLSQGETAGHLFDRLDEDQDGFITEDEARAMHEKRGKGPGGKGPGGKGHGGKGPGEKRGQVDEGAQG
jgi:Ca2+-binding EF-hand superfamily protein